MNEGMKEGRKEGRKEGGREWTNIIEPTISRHENNGT